MRNLKLVRFLVFWLRYQLIETTLSSKKNEALQAIEQKKDLSLYIYINISRYLVVKAAQSQKKFVLFAINLWKICCFFPHEVK